MILKKSPKSRHTISLAFAVPTRERGRREGLALALVPVRGVGELCVPDHGAEQAHLMSAVTLLLV